MQVPQAGKCWSQKTLCIKTKYVTGKKWHVIIKNVQQPLCNGPLKNLLQREKRYPGIDLYMHKN